MDLPQYQTSAAFGERERAVLDLAVAMAGHPVDISEELRARLRQYFDDSQLVELAAAIALENLEARFNRVFNVQATGYSEGAVCALPERHQSL